MSSTNESKSISIEDLNLIIILEPYYNIFVYILFFLKNLFFIFIFVLLNKAQSKALQGYRFYLSINVTTTYTFGFFFVLYQPIILLPDLIICSVGLLSKLGPYVSFVLLVLCVGAFFYHLIGIIFCLTYQYAHVELNQFTKIFSYDKIKQLIYSAICMGFVLIILIAAILFITVYEYVDSKDIVKVELHDYTDKKHNCFYLHIWSNVFLIIIVIGICVVELIFIISFGYLHAKMIHIVFIKNKDYSDKTHRMQKMLYISIFGQTLGFCSIYLVPLFAVFLVFITNFNSISSVLLLILAFINCYELANYIIIIFTISYFRNNLTRLVFGCKGVRLSLEVTATVVRPFVARTAKNNVVIHISNISTSDKISGLQVNKDSNSSRRFSNMTHGKTTSRRLSSRF